MKEKTIITERTDGAFNKITYLWDTECNEALDIIEAEIISTEEAGGQNMKKTYTIIAKRWFQRSNGNTYHSVTIYDEATLLDRVPFTYGYGSHYEQTALAMLQKLNIASPETTVFWKWEEEYGRDKVLVICEDVKRKKDL